MTKQTRRNLVLVVACTAWLYMQSGLTVLAKTGQCPSICDMDRDGDCDFMDFRWVQLCAGEFLKGPMPLFCCSLDIDGNGVIDESDLLAWNVSRKFR